MGKDVPGRGNSKHKGPELETSLVYLKNRKEEVCIRLEGDRGKREEVWGWGRVSRQPREPRREGCRVCSSRSGSLSISTLGSSGVQTTLPLLSGHVCTSLLSLQGLQSNLSSSITTRAHGFLLSPPIHSHIYSLIHQILICLRYFALAVSSAWNTVFYLSWLCFHH